EVRVVDLPVPEAERRVDDLAPHALVVEVLESYRALRLSLASLLHREEELRHRLRGGRFGWPRELAAKGPTVDVHDLLGVADLLGTRQPFGERAREVLLEEIARLDEVRVAGARPQEIGHQAATPRNPARFVLMIFCRSLLERSPNWFTYVTGSGSPS